MGTNFVLLTLFLFAMFCHAANGDSVEKKLIVKSVLNLIIHKTALKQHFHPELKRRIPLKIATNEQFNEDIDLSAFGRPILFYSKANSREFIDIIKFQINGNLVEFSLSYKVEGVFLDGFAVFCEGAWQLKEVRLVEHNG